MRGQLAPFALGIALSLPPAASLAQSNTPESADQSTSTLPPVIVDAIRPRDVSEGSGQYTVPATRSATGLRLSNQETPQAVNVITNQQMRDQGVDTAKDALKRGIGISVERVDGPRYSISSRGHDINNYQFDGANAAVNDDQGDLVGDSILYDRIEIVRGANSLIGGSGTPGASVNLVRKHANSSKQETSLDLGIGRYKERDISLDHSQPLNQDGSLRGRMVLHHNSKHTFMDRVKQENNTVYGILDADITPNDTLSLGFSQENRELRDTPWGGLPDFDDNGARIVWPRHANPAPKWSNWDSSAKTVFIESTNSIDQDLNITTKAGHRAAKTKPKILYIGENAVTQEDGLTGEPVAGKYDYDRKQNYFQIQTDGKFHAWQQTHDFMIGLSYSRSKDKDLTFDPEESSMASAEEHDIWAGNFPEPEWSTAPTGNTQVTDTRLSLFASSRLKLNNQASMIIGGRFSNWKYQDKTTGDEPIDYKKNGVWTPYAGILYNITPQNTLYASYTDIFDRQTERDINKQLIGPSRGKSYEIGWKGS